MVKVTKFNLKKKSSFLQSKNKFPTDCHNDLTKNDYGSNILLFIIIFFYDNQLEIYFYFEERKIFSSS
jgi:hypothetical protein